MTTATLVEVRVSEVSPSPDQNREVFDPRELEELAESIRELGLLQPITVRPMMLGYVLVAGERRLRAVKLLGWETVPAIVRSDDADTDSALRTLAENMVRVDPGPLEEAHGLAAVSHEHSLEVSELARRLGKSSRWVKDRLALLALADDVAHYVQTGGLPLGRAVLMSVLDVNRQRLALQAHEHGITPDAFRALVEKLSTEQASECMFDVDTFLRVEEYVIEAEEEAQGMKPQPIRERPCGIAEIAELLEVKSQTVHQWRQRDIFPAPAGTVGGSPFWWESTVLAWAQETGRAPKP